MMLTAAVLLLPVLQGPVSETQAAHVGNDAVKVHAAFKDTTQVLAELPPGTPVRIVQDVAPWARVEVPGGFPAWVFGDLLTVDANGYGTVAKSNVNARPLPSTGRDSYPLGKFPAGVKMAVLGRDGDWVQVLAPENITGWVLARELKRHPAVPVAFSSDWDRAAGSRLAAMQGANAAPVRERRPEPKPVTIQVPDEVEVVAPAVVHEPVTAPAAKPAEAAARNESVGLTVAEDVPVALAPPANPGSAEVAAAAPERLAQAETDLTKLARGVFDFHEADRIESEFSALLWAVDDQALKQRATDGLAQLDALRKAYDLEHQLQREQTEYQAEAVVADRTAAELEAEFAAEPERAPLEHYDATGWIEYREGYATTVPYALVRGGEVHPLEVLDGRYRLSDFRGREVALKGFWKRLPTGERFLEITKIRVVSTQ